MGPDARRANIRSVLITDVHISGANCNNFDASVNRRRFKDAVQRVRTTGTLVDNLC